MSSRNLAILGSTGSIGQSTAKVILDHPEAFDVKALGAFRSVDLLEKQYRQFRPDYLCLIDPDAAAVLSGRLKDEPVEVLCGPEDMVRLAGLDNVDTVLNAVVGAAGLRVSLAAVEHGKKLALANKESLVAGGPLFADLCSNSKPTILPVDSEHSAIWQALRAGEEKEVKNIILTASGGPFRTLPMEEFANITVERALVHPTWDMGAKITIDSATMTNKGLEVIEAAVLFSVPVDRVKIVVHPQSIIHSMVEFCDSSVIAQLSNPDMCLPIVYALFWPERAESSFGRIDWSEMKDLTFEDPDYKRFPAIKLAYEVARVGGTAPAVYNAANEIAVGAFLKEAIKFTDIADIVIRTIDSVDIIQRPQLDDILRADEEARERARQTVETQAC